MSEISGPLVFGCHLSVERLGEGSRSVVYLARSVGPSGVARPVVVQRFRATAAIDARDRFVSESRILSLLRHPGVVPLVGSGIDRGGMVRVLDYVTGYDLGRWLRYRRAASRPLPRALAAHVAACVLETLADVERVASLTEALRPSNVMLDRLGNVLVTDLRLAPGDARGKGWAAAALLDELLGSAGLEIRSVPELRAIAGDACEALMRALDLDFDALPRMQGIRSLEARDQAWRSGPHARRLDAEGAIR